MNTFYQEFKPCPALQPFVDCYWLHCAEAGGDEESPVQRCVPFGTLKIILQLDSPNCQFLSGSTWNKLPQAYFVGLYRDAVQWKSVGSVRKFAIELKPESLLQLFNVPVASLCNNYTDLETFFGRDINRLVEQVHGIQDINTVVKAVEAFLLGQFRHLKADRHYLYEATRLIRQSQGNLSIEALSERLSISTRQLERSFKDNFGTTPKTYQRIVRFRSAYEHIQENTAIPNWLDVSYAFGYSDQAHFIRDFKEFTADVPSLVFRDTSTYFRTANKQPAGMPN